MDPIEKKVDALLKYIQEFAANPCPEMLEFAIFLEEVEASCGEALKMIRKKRKRRIK